MAIMLMGLMLKGWTPPVFAADLPQTLKVGDQTLSLNGSGYRKKLFIKLYNAGLYLKQSNQNAAAIIKADEIMAIELNIISDLITAEKMESAIVEGFGNSTNNNMAPLTEEIEQFLMVFRQGIKEGDIFTFSYQPSQGTTISKNKQLQATINGLAFKQALFGIWLSDKPAQASLKTLLLGK
jgi:hypothetical protein